MTETKKKRSKGKKLILTYTRSSKADYPRKVLSKRTFLTSPEWLSKLKSTHQQPACPNEILYSPLTMATTRGCSEIEYGYYPSIGTYYVVLRGGYRFAQLD
jgi:hypothetical protein